jgi:hypothetical protein
MKAIRRAIFVLTMIVLAPLMIVAVLLIVPISYSIITNKCENYTVDIVPSPTGRLSVVRVEHRCSTDEDARPLIFALLRPGERIERKDVFLIVDHEQLTGADSRVLWSPLSIFAKWIDERNLLIAAPEGSTLKKGQTEFRDVQIQYAFYPMDSDKTKDEYLRQQVEKTVSFEPRFRMDDGIGVPGIGCHLDITAYDGEYLDQLSLSLDGRTTFAVKAIDRGKIVLNEAYSGYNFQIVARDDIQRTDKHATDADVVGFAPKDGRSTLWIYDLNYPSAKAPNGTPVPKWYFGYNPKNSHDIMSIAEKIKDGTIAVRVGFWLDNEVVVYSGGGKPTDQKPVEMFEQCINENRIFDTPRHRTDQ